MTPMDSTSTILSYTPPAPTDVPAKRLVSGNPDGTESIFTFYDRIEIGRLKPKQARPGVLMVDDPTVSSRHCVITQDREGRCSVRDVSRNGTRLDGRRLSPNLSTEISVGQSLSIGRDLKLILDGDPVEDGLDEGSGVSEITGTVGMSSVATVTVLVGDIRGYTQLVQKADPVLLQESVNRVFDRMEREVESLGGTLKEFQGDAIFAFWERNGTGCHATDACDAALRLKTLSTALADDRSVWALEELPLEMDFALATGPVNISGYGGDGALGLSMVGEPVVLAYRIEKYADDTTGPIIVCPMTRELTDEQFEFRSIGEREAKGFDTPFDLYALIEAKNRP
jgi:class 3 adenylate cyclase